MFQNNGESLVYRDHRVGWLSVPACHPRHVNSTCTQWQSVTSSVTTSWNDTTKSWQTESWSTAAYTVKDWPTLIQLLLYLTIAIKSMFWTLNLLLVMLSKNPMFIFSINNKIYFQENKYSTGSNCESNYNYGKNENFYWTDVGQS